MPLFPRIGLLLVGALLASVPPGWAQRADVTAANELDAFMEKVLAQRDVNRRTLEQYVLDETERFEILGPGRMRLHGLRREFTWYVRDGMHVRSPLRFDGVPVGDADRDRYERRWMERERERLARREKKQAASPEREVTLGGGVELGGQSLPGEPRFVSEAYFMDFRFEPGNYYLAGREQLEGQEVLRVEYYPERLFSDETEARDPERQQRREERRARQSDRDREIEDDINRRMNKTALVTLWVDPRIHQIVKYTFENVWLDFLPGGWLVKVDDLRASMAMGQPFEGVWLPRDIEVHAGVTLANGSFEFAYGRAFRDYRLAEVKTRIRVPQDARGAGPGFGSPAAREAANANHEAGPPGPAGERDRGGRLAWLGDGRLADGRPAVFRQEVIRELRVHGNAYVADEEVLRIAGLSIGDTATEATLREAETRLRASRLFDTIDVRKRYRSLADETDVAIVLVVHERPGVRPDSAEPSAPLPRPPGPLGRLGSRLMFLPILGYEDGYGLTYGARMSAVDWLGFGERLSVPGTWGGTRRLALEFERVLDRGPLTRISSTAEIRQRENPRFEIDDRRLALSARAERSIARQFRLGAEASRASIDFGGLDDTLTTVGADAALDLRRDPAFPRNAVFLGVGWSSLGFRQQPGRTNLYRADARAFVRAVGQSVVAARAQYMGADRPLPPYERLLLGGAGTLRGYRAGSFDGDRSLVTSTELRVPLTSVLRSARFGVSAFADAGRAWNRDEPMESARWHRGVGGGLFLVSPVLRLNLDVARGLDDGRTRIHLGTGFAF